MGRTIGQRVVIENLAGAGGTTGGARGARAEPDGYTLTVGSLGSHGAAAALYKNIQYDARELEPIGLIAGTPGYFVVRKDFPARTMPEFLAYVKANPGKVTNGHAGVGSTPHLACLYLTHLTGMSLVSTPYRGSGPAMNDLVAGQIDSMCDLAPTVVPQIQAGTIRGLMLAQAERSGGDAGRADRQGGRPRAVSVHRLERGLRAEGHAAGRARQAFGRAPGGARRRCRAAADRGARLDPAEARRAHARAPAPGRARRRRQMGRSDPRRRHRAAIGEGRNAGIASFSVIPGPREARNPEPTRKRRPASRSRGFRVLACGEPRND
jgi:hypothetical protein